MIITPRVAAVWGVMPSDLGAELWVEEVLGVIHNFVPLVEVGDDGFFYFEPGPPARTIGGEQPLSEALEQHLKEQLGANFAAQIGIAEGIFAASLAAKLPGLETRIIALDTTAEFLSPLPLSFLGDAELARKLHQLGLSTLGAFAALPRTSVLERFGQPVAALHDLASGIDLRQLEAEAPSPEYLVDINFEPPVERLDQLAFGIKALADRLYQRLMKEGLAFGRLRVRAVGETHEAFERYWRLAGPIDAVNITERVRWQLEGWTRNAARRREQRGIKYLSLEPLELYVPIGRQLSFWDKDSDRDENAFQALARLGELLGETNVNIPVVAGGRNPNDLIELVPTETVRFGLQSSGLSKRKQLPWPGQVPPPMPASVLMGKNLVVQLLDTEGARIGVSARGLLSGNPAKLCFSEQKGALPPDCLNIRTWSGPWLLEESWWDATRHKRQVRMQVVAEDESAWLLVLEKGLWSVSAIYD